MKAECGAGETFHFEAGEARARVDLSVYRLAAIKKTAYRLADRCTVVLGETVDGLISLRILFPSTVQEADAREGIRLFFQELLDQELREHIAEEVGPVRALLLAHAFSKTNLLGDP